MDPWHCEAAGLTTVPFLGEFGFQLSVALIFVTCQLFFSSTGLILTLKFGLFLLILSYLNNYS